MKKILYGGLDVHAESIAVEVAEGGRNGEVLGFVWAIATHTEQGQALSTHQKHYAYFLDSSAEGSVVPRKGEPSSTSMRHGPRPQPARLVRGSSRRIMTLRFRPAYIRVIYRRVIFRAAFDAAVPNIHPKDKCPPP